MSERTRPVDNDVVPLKHPGRIIAAVVLLVLVVAFIWDAATRDAYAWDIYFDYLVVEGKPTHLPDPHDRHLWHTGRFEYTTCALADWFEDDDEPLSGDFTFGVEAFAENGGWVFRPVKAVTS